MKKKTLVESKEKKGQKSHISLHPKLYSVT